MKNKICTLLAVLLAAGILYGCTAQNTEPRTAKATPLVIEYPERNYYGNIRVYAEGVKAFEYEGYIDIAEDGYTGQDVQIIVYYGDTEGDAENEPGE